MQEAAQLGTIHQIEKSEMDCTSQPASPPMMDIDHQQKLRPGWFGPGYVSDLKLTSQCTKAHQMQSDGPGHHPIFLYIGITIRLS